MAIALFGHGGPLRGIRVLGDWFPVHSNCTKDSIGLRIVVDY